jgi:hypothetical protein
MTIYATTKTVVLSQFLTYHCIQKKSSIYYIYIIIYIMLYLSII